jgi:hypothetical protein
MYYIYIYTPGMRDGEYFKNYSNNFYPILTEWISTAYKFKSFNMAYMEKYVLRQSLHPKTKLEIRYVAPEN